MNAPTEGPKPIAAVLVGPVIPVTVPKDALSNTVPNIMLPSTKMRLVVVVQITTSINPYAGMFITVKRMVGTMAILKAHIAIVLVVNLSVKYPHTGTESPPNTFPNVNAPAAAF